MRSTYLDNERIDTIYLGGGTPSLLDQSELEVLFKAVHNCYELNSDPEITLEANPENLTTEALEFYSELGINRLSIGIQSFHEPYLQYLNRSHSPSEAIKGIENARSSKIAQISLDLIFGIMPEDDAIWEADLKTALKFNPDHLSLYNLTIEPGTVFGNRQQKGMLKESGDEQCRKQYIMGHELLAANNYEHYEISNYALPGHYSRHNTSYWNDIKFLGVGPGAHSYDLKSRQYNIRNNALYIQSISSDKIPATIEVLTATDKFNEKVLTGLRTKWGIKASFLREAANGKNIEKISDFISRGLMVESDDNLKLTLEGQLVADSLISRLMI